MRASQVARGMAAKRCDQELGDGGPGAGRQGDAARADAVAGGQRQRAHGGFARQAALSADTISANAGRAAGRVMHAARLRAPSAARASRCPRRRPAGSAPAAPRAGGRRRAPRCAAGPAPARRRRGGRKEAAPKSPSRQSPCAVPQDVVGVEIAVQDAARMQLRRGRGDAACHAQRDVGATRPRRRRRRRACRTARLGGPGQVAEGAGRPAPAPGPACPRDGCSTWPSTAIRLGCAPAAMQAAISLCGQPSLVTAPLNSFTATGRTRAVRTLPVRPVDHAGRAFAQLVLQRKTCASRWPAWPARPAPPPRASSSKGLPAKASQDSRGSDSSQSGRASRRLAEMRSSSSPLAGRHLGRQRTAGGCPRASASAAACIGRCVGRQRLDLVVGQDQPAQRRRQRSRRHVGGCGWP